MRLWLAILAAALPACGFHAATNQKDGGGGDDVQPDAQSCFGSLAFDKICFTTPPTLPVMSFPSAINTDDTSMCDQNNDRKGNYCVIAGTAINVPVSMVVRAYGMKPLVLLATGQVEIHGKVDVSSNHNATAMDVGAGANPPTVCTGATAAVGNSGGYGGTFGGRGGDGQSKDGAPGVAADPTGLFPPALRGGCPGGNGVTTSSGGATAGAGGAGGGAVAIIAAGLTIDGTINASGAGGTGGSANRSGGGGGGAGGMIVLDVATTNASGAVAIFANGGGGAEGGSGPNSGGTAAVGAPGGESTGPTTPGAKGAVNPDGGDGGDGSSGATVPGGSNATGMSQHDGGGGAGGGGAGVIHAPNVATPALAPASTNPTP